MRSASRTFLFAVAVFGVALVVPGWAAEIQVPTDYATIQEAIDAAVNGDVVVVAPGIYVENIDFVGKAITVRSSDGPEVTVIDGENPADPDRASVVIFENGEGLDSVLAGFTIRHGTGTLVLGSDRSGGGIHCHDSTPTIEGNVIKWNVLLDRHSEGAGINFKDCPGGVLRNNVIAYNNSLGSGGGVTCSRSSPWLEGNLVFNNHGEFDGGGLNLGGNPGATIIGNRIFLNTTNGGGGAIRSAEGDPVILNNTMFGNLARDGGAIHFWQSDAIVVGNTMHGNSAWGNGGGGIRHWSGSPVVVNCILWSNDPNQIQGNPNVSYCDVEGGWSGAGNIDSDPMFVNTSGEDFHLRLESPCVDAGTNDPPSLPPTDYEGDARIIDGDRDTLAVADMGADEEIFHVAARFGGVNAESDELANVLFVNGSAGNSKREVRIGQTDALVISMDVPPAGPDPAPFVLYGWRGESDDTTATIHPRLLGCMCFPSPWSGGDPQPRAIWNNIGCPEVLGEATKRSTPAPSTLLDWPAGVGVEITVTFQGAIRDLGSAASANASITNAVMLQVE